MLLPAALQKRLFRQIAIVFLSSLQEGSRLSSFFAEEYDHTIDSYNEVRCAAEVAEAYPSWDVFIGMYV
jgi:hypothetical protein